MDENSEEVNNPIYRKKLRMCVWLIDWFKRNGCEINKCFKIEFDLNNQDAPIYKPENNLIIIQQDSSDPNYPIFIFQVAHELTHACISSGFLSSKIRWIDELIASNMSYFALEYVKEVRPELKASINEYLVELSLPFIPKYTGSSAKNIIINNIDVLEATPRLVYLPDSPCFGLSAFLYRNKDQLNIWELINFFKKFVIPYTYHYINNGVIYNSKNEQFVSVNYQSLVEPLKDTNLQFFADLLN